METRTEIKSTAQKIGYTIRRAEQSDEQAITQLLETYVTTQGAALRYEWLYKRNPQGQAETWLACEPLRGQIIGFTSIFAREFLVNGRTVTGGIGFDAFVRPDHRRRGIALELHKESRADMESGEVPFRFMCGPPVPANLKALVKAGSRVVGPLRYIGLPLTTAGVLSMLHIRGSLADKLSTKGSFIDRTLAGTRKLIVKPDPKVKVQIVHKVDQSMDRLWEETSPNFSVIGRRDSEYLYWRYLQNPVCWQQLISVKLNDRLIGWAALEFSSQGCLLVDYLFPVDSKEADLALGAIISYAANRGASRLTLRFNLLGHYKKLFLSKGFLPGWSKELFQVLCDDQKLLPQLLDQPGWHFSNGDLNPEASPWSVNFAPQAHWTDANYKCNTWPELAPTPELLLDLKPSTQTDM